MPRIKATPPVRECQNCIHKKYVIREGRAMCQIFLHPSKEWRKFAGCRCYLSTYEKEKIK